MAVQPKRVRIENIDSDIGAFLDDADDGPLLIERNGLLYRLSRADDDIWAGYDPDRALAALEATAGSWSDIDADAMIAELHAARALGS